jgi:predicted DNA-binding protein with PD1-like motif/glutaredoxin
MQAVPLHLAPGSDLRRSLEEFAVAHASIGFVLGVVGDLSQAAFQCPGQPNPSLIEGDLEIITLNGTVAPQGVHLHLSLSDGTCQVWGGHLEHGSLVRKGADLLVGLVAAAPLPGTPSPAAVAPVAPPRLAVQAAHPVVEIAVLSGCPFSARALRMLRTLGIPHQVQVVRCSEQRDAIAQRSGQASLPQVFIDGRAIGGYDALAELHGQGALEGLRAW